MEIGVRNVDYSYEYSSRQVLSNINFTVTPGEKVALLGANGCGKTTLLKILCGLFAPTRGSVLIDGVEVKPKASFGFRVGFVPENPEEMFFESTVEREIAFILKRKNESNVDEKVNKILSEFDLLKLSDSSPFEISSGERKKVSIAAVVVAEQPVILLDEPISGLDWNGIIAVEKWIKDSKASIVVTSHRTDFARIFDRIVLMNGGGIVSDNINLNNSREALEKSGVLLLWR